MLEIRKFRISDIKKLEPVAIDESLHGRTDYCKRWAEVNLNSGPAYTGLYDGQIVGAAGIRLMSSDTGMVWAVFSPLFKLKLKSSLRTMKELMKIVLTEFDLKYLYATSRKGFAASQRLLQHFGFEEAGLEDKKNIYYVRET